MNAKEPSVEPIGRPAFSNATEGFADVMASMVPNTIGGGS